MTNLLLISYVHKYWKVNSAALDCKIPLPGDTRHSSPNIKFYPSTKVTSKENRE